MQTDLTDRMPYLISMQVMVMKWTTEQQEAIEIRGKNILVSAAAGSGKTAVLVERIKQLIIQDQIPIDHMLIVTFSNAAASEMREKIVDAISGALEGTAETSAGAQKEAFLREQLNLIHRANISTFHSFSMEVIRRYFYLVDIEPSFKICDEAQKTILQAEAMEKLFGNLFESSSQDFLDFLSKFALTRNDNAVKDMIYEVHNFIQSIPDSFLWLRQKAEGLSCTREMFERSPVFLEMQGEIGRALILAENCFLKAGEILEVQGISSLIPKWRLEAEALEALRKGFETLPFDEFARSMRDVKFQTYTVSKAEKESYEEMKEAVAALRDQGKSIIRKLTAQYMARPLEAYVEDCNKTGQDALYLCFLVEEFDRLYQEKKKNKNLIDFNDIEHYALAVLSNKEAAAEYTDKFDYIFIDEYQDSNLVQETLISRIKRENNLFMVGDVKQSIYKFRLAEPEIFIKKYELFKENKSAWDKKLDLNKNFRSKGSIIAAVNDIFSQIMNKDLSGLEYDEAAALYQGNPYDGNLDYPVELQIVDEKQLDDLSIDDEIKEMKKAEMEAYTAAKIIKESKGSLIYDGKKGVERPLANNDIVILLRGAKGYAEVYYEALMKEGIPAFVDTSDGYFDTLEIEIFLNLIRIIDNRKQDIPLLSILRSPMFGFTMEELIEIRIHKKEGAYHKVFMEYAESGEKVSLRKKCGNTLARINNWKRKTPLMPLEDFLWLLIRETGYYEYIGGIPGGSQRQANLRALIDKAIQFQSSQMKGLFSFINYIEAIKKRKVSMGQVKLIGENDDVVRIMTIHKSKGLEFPMVLVGGLGKRFHKESDTYQVSLHKDLGLGLRFVDKENSCYKKTIFQTVIDQKKQRESLAEELRILYVAFTRAKDKLILLGTLKDTKEMMEVYSRDGKNDFTGAKSYMELLIPALAHTKIIEKHASRSDISFQKGEASYRKNIIRKQIESKEDVFVNPEGGDGELEKQALKDEIERRLGYEYGYQQALTLKSKFTVSELNRLTEEKGKYDRKTVAALDIPKFTKENSKFTGAEKGTILHKVMEQLDFRQVAAMWDAGKEAGKEVEKETKTEGIRAMVDDLVQREILSADEAGTVSIPKIIGFFESEIGKRACNGNQLYKEVSFNIMKEMSGEGIIIQGTIDCYFEEEGKYILLDYKSNYVSESGKDDEIERMTESYKAQLELYKEALEKIRGVKVEEAYLYLFSVQKGVKLS